VSFRERQPPNLSILILLQPEGSPVSPLAI